MPDLLPDMPHTGQTGPVVSTPVNESAGAGSAVMQQKLELLEQVGVIQCISGGEVGGRCVSAFDHRRFFLLLMLEFSRN